MATNRSTLSQKIRIYDQLIGSLNDTSSKSKTVLSELSRCVKLHENLISSISKQSTQTSRKEYSKNKTNSDYNENIKENINNIYENTDKMVLYLSDIRDYLLSKNTEEKHKSGNYSQRSDNNIEIKNTGSDSKGMKAAAILAALSAVSSKLSSLTGKAMEDTATLQQFTGLSRDSISGYRGNFNKLYEGSDIYSSATEWERLQEIIKATGMDDMDKLLKYTKATAVGVESMGLDTSQLASLLYVIEKRGTFTSAQMDNVIDALYKYSAGGGEVTPEELTEAVSSIAESLTVDVSANRRDEETAEVAQVMSAALNEGFDVDFVSQISNIINSVLTEGYGSQYASSIQSYTGLGVEDIKRYASQGDYSELYKLMFQGLSGTASRFSGSEELTTSFLNALGFDSSDRLNRTLLKSFDIDESINKLEDNISSQISEGQQADSAENAAADQYRDIVEKGLTHIGNTLDDTFNWLSEGGLGGEFFSTLSKIFGSIGLFKLISKLLGTGGSNIPNKTGGSNIPNKTGGGIPFKYGLLAAEIAAVASVPSSEDQAIATQKAEEAQELENLKSSQIGDLYNTEKVKGTSYSKKVAKYPYSETIKEILNRYIEGKVDEDVAFISIKEAVSKYQEEKENYTDAWTGNYDDKGREDLDTLIKEVSPSFYNSEDYKTSMEDSLFSYILGNSANPDSSQLSSSLLSYVKKNNSYDVGTNYVPEDQLAFIHEGEAIIPKEFNPTNNSQGIPLYNSITKQDIEDLKTITKNLYTLIENNFDLTTKRYEEDKLDQKSQITRNNLQSAVRTYTPTYY